jgi:hypothetical protein
MIREKKRLTKKRMNREEREVRKEEGIGNW